MLQKKREHPEIKSGLHTRNKHTGRYNFNKLIGSCAELAPFVRLNDYGDESIDFSNAEAVMLLNKALLKFYYGITHWCIPAGYLCPPIPGRADYIHHAADLLANANKGKIPTGNKIKCLDIGVGANCIYPIIGRVEYGWSFVGSDADKLALKSASEIVELNSTLKEQVDLRLQENLNSIFKGIIDNNECFDLSICNPPFHASIKDAEAATLRKLSNLNAKKVTKPSLNFGGQNNELWCQGGEAKFVQTMIEQSTQFASNCFWFSTLVSKQSNLKSIYKALQNANALEVKTIPMSQGNKVSRIVAWTYLTKTQQQHWIAERWKE